MTTITFKKNKDTIEHIKSNPDLFFRFVQNEKVSNIVYLLNKLGRLNGDFNKGLLTPLLSHDNKKIRFLALKNLAKLQDIELVKYYKDILKKDESADVRREAVSAIGRLRNKENINFLIELLKDKDPEVVLQAIRGLLVFKKEKIVLNNLIKLKNHKNEIVREIIEIEFKTRKKNVKKQKHTEFSQLLKNKVVLGDAQKILKYVPDESIHLTFTSPPYYNARDYSTYQSYEEYLTFLEKIFKEIYRTTKEGRFFILNTSPIIIPRVSRNHSSKRYPIPYDLHSILMKMGWEFIDDIIWAKPEASVKNRNAGFLQHRKPLAYKANSRSEMIMVYRKKTDKLIDWNMKQYPFHIVNESKVHGKYETSNIWNIDPVFDKTHSAVFPEELCNRVIKFYSFIGDLVFDPFAGSGTLGKSALKLKRNFFLTEKDKKYFERIKEILGEKSDIIYSKFNNKKI